MKYECAQEMFIIWSKGKGRIEKVPRIKCLREKVAGIKWGVFVLRKERRIEKGCLPAYVHKGERGKIMSYVEEIQ
jgi:hypothetical protein